MRFGEVEVDSELIDAPVGPARLRHRPGSRPLSSWTLARATARSPEAVAAVDGTEARLAITADRLLDNPRIAGTVSVAGAPVAQAAGFLGIEPSTEAELGGFDLVSRIVLEPVGRRLMLVDLEGTVFDMALSGNVAFDNEEVAGYG